MSSSFHIERRLLPPASEALMGTDRMGSDIFSRLLFGARITLMLAGIAVGSALLIGVPIGLIAGYYQSWVSDALMRVAEIFLAVPQIVLAIAIAQTLGPSIQNVILALSLTYWPFWARLVYAETRSMRNEVFVESAVALGASPWRVIVLHILPNIASPIIVRTSIGMGATILTAATLGFLGPGRPAANAGMGPHDRREPRIPARGLVVCAGTGHRDLPDRARLQPLRGRPARHPRPAYAQGRLSR
jgi:peptide/nickel transport system permease protein